MRFDGIAASPGIGVGPIFCFETEEFAVKDHRIAPEGIEAEIQRLKDALAEARSDLERLHDGIAAELGRQEAAIYDAHLLMVGDPELMKHVVASIRNERQNAAFAFRRYMSSVAAHFARVEDEYLKERRADVIDVERRVLRHLLGHRSPSSSALVEPSIVVAHDVGPSEVAVLDPEKVIGLVTEVGGRTSHTAIVARGRGIPAVLSVAGVMKAARGKTRGALDGYRGRFVVDPDPETTRRYRERRRLFEQEAQLLKGLKEERACTPDGKTIDIGANIELPGDVDRVLASGADGIGLFRTEFFYLGRYELPSEEEQYETYSMVAECAAPRPVIFRTMDLGGDKVASYLGMTHETNPFLGWRGIRFALHHPDVFRTQIRAIYRASAHGRVRMMFPMISTLEELQRALDLCADVRADLQKAGIAHDADLEIGIMVETPSAVWIADVLARQAHFLSIGTNDLVQYTLAMDRDNERLAHLYEPLEPAILRSIHHTVQAGHAHGRWVGVCGEMSGDPLTAVLLMGLGVDEMSMTSFDVPRVKAAVRSVPFDTAEELARDALAMPAAREVKDLLSARIEPLLPDYLIVNRNGP